MEEKTESFVTAPIANVLRMSKLVGIAPLQFVKHENGWRTRICNKNHVISCIIVTVLDIVVMVVMIEEISNMKNRTVIFRVAWVIETFLEILTATITVCCAKRHMKTLINCLNIVRKINVKLLPTRPFKINKPFVLMTYFWWAFTIAGSAIDYIVSINHFQLRRFETWVKVLYAFCYVISYIMQLGIIQFVLINFYVQTCFKSIKVCLKDLLRSDSKIYHASIQAIASEYAAACKAVRDISHCYGLIVLLNFICLLIHLANTPYYMIINILKTDQDAKHAFGYFFYNTKEICWSLYHFFNLLFVIEPCHLIITEMECIRKLVSHLMVRVESLYDPLAIEMDQFYIQLELNKVSYKPMKVFTISRSLALKIFGTVTTYLVVMLKSD